MTRIKQKDARNHKVITHKKNDIVILCNPIKYRGAINNHRVVAMVNSIHQMRHVTKLRPSLVF